MLEKWKEKCQALHVAKIVMPTPLQMSHPHHVGTQNKNQCTLYMYTYIYRYIYVYIYTQQEQQHTAEH